MYCVVFLVAYDYAVHMVSVLLCLLPSFGAARLNLLSDCGCAFSWAAAHKLCSFAMQGFPAPGITPPPSKVSDEKLD